MVAASEAAAALIPSPVAPFDTKPVPPTYDPHNVRLSVSPINICLSVILPRLSLSVFDVDVL
jgi:hypothetical protein